MAVDRMEEIAGTRFRGTTGSEKPIVAEIRRWTIRAEKESCITVARTRG